MPNILPTGSQSLPSENKPRPSYAKASEGKHQISFLGVVLTIILAVVIILLGERIMFDLNKVANPVIASTVSNSRTSPMYYNESYANMAMDKSSLSGTRVYYPYDKTGEYKLYKLLIHGAFVLPIFLLMFLFYYWMNLKQKNPYWQVVVWGYMVASIWLLLHLVGEAGKYVIDQYKNAAIYIILVFLAVVLTSLAVFIQKKKLESAN